MLSSTFTNNTRRSKGKTDIQSKTTFVKEKEYTKKTNNMSEHFKQKYERLDKENAEKGEAAKMQVVD